MRSQIEPDAAADAALFAPALAHLRPVAIEMRLEIDHLAQRPSFSSAFRVRKSLSQRRLWNTDSSNPLCCACCCSTCACDNVTVNGLSTTTCLPAASACCASGNGYRWGRNHDQIEGRIGEQRLRITHHRHRRPVGVHFAGIAAGDGGQLEPRRTGDQRRMKVLPA